MNNQQDADLAARIQLLEDRAAIKNVVDTFSVLADELLTACQAIDIRRMKNSHGQGISPVHQAIYDLVRSEVAFYEIDREIRPDLEAVDRIVRDEKLLQIVDEMVPDFN